MKAYANRRAITFAAIVALLVAAGLVAAAPAAQAVGVTISGTVTLPADAPQEYLNAVSMQLTNVADNATTNVAVSPVDGTYVSGAIAPGSYWVEFKVSPYDIGGGTVTPALAAQYAHGKYGRTNADIVDAGSGSVSGVDATLAWTGSISGTVTLASGLPAAWLKGVNVSLAGDMGFSKQVSPNPATGAWTATGIPAGHYRVYFSPAGYLDGGNVTYPTFIEQYYMNAYTLSASTSVTVTGQGSVTGVNARLDTVGHFTTTTTPVIAHVALNSGSTLGMSEATWVPAANFTVRWKRNGTAIAGATHTTYVLTPADRGKTITVTVTGTRSGFATESKTSAPLAIPLPFTRTATPTITGTAKAGYTLTAHRGTWTPAVTSASYQWKIDGGVIDGATHSTYKVTASDRGHDITVTVTGKRSGYLSTPRTSDPIHISRVFATAVTPTITGTAKVGSTLTAHRGTWSPTPKYSYKWYRNGAAISGATHATYKLTSSDKGKKITVRVTGTKVGYVTATKTSAAKAVS